MNHQFEASQQELVAARKEISRINEAAQEQDKRMRELENDSKLREEQFDLVRQQLSSREEMLRESTNSFRKELNRFRSRINDLEAELDRRRQSPAAVVGHWGYRSGGGSDSNNQNNNNNTTFVGTLRPHQSPNNNKLVSAEPDPRGILAAAASMDQINQGSSNTNHPSSGMSPTSSLPPNNMTFDSNNPNASFAGGGGGFGSPQHNNNTITATSNNSNESLSRTLFSVAGATDDFSPSQLSIPRIVQLASDVGMQEAVNEMKREFDKKLFAVKERFMQDKRESLAQLKSKQEMTILKLKRDVEERDRELINLREQVSSSNKHQHEEENEADHINNNIHQNQVLNGSQQQQESAPPLSGQTTGRKDTTTIAAVSNSPGKKVASTKKGASTTKSSKTKK